MPFCEYFLFPYLYWFVFLIGMHLYLLLFDTAGFRKFMWFIILTYTATCIIYLIYPSQQELRPETFRRDNLLTRFMTWFYAFDTNTNVCPSLHVIGSLAVLAAAWNTPRFATPLWRTAFTLQAVLISISTVFLKQHSSWTFPRCGPQRHRLLPGLHTPPPGGASQLPENQVAPRQTGNHFRPAGVYA